jgi:hypothetical protein
MTAEVVPSHNFSTSAALNSSARPSPSDTFTPSSELNASTRPSPSYQFTSSPPLKPRPTLSGSLHASSDATTFSASPLVRFSVSAGLKPTSPLDDRHSGGPIPDAGFKFGWVIGVAAGVLLLAIVAAVFGWRHCHKEVPPAAEVSNDMEGEVWMENPETLWDEQIYESVFVPTHDETMFVRI